MPSHRAESAPKCPVSTLRVPPSARSGGEALLLLLRESDRQPTPADILRVMRYYRMLFDELNRV